MSQTTLKLQFMQVEQQTIKIFSKYDNGYSTSIILIHPEWQ